MKKYLILILILIYYNYAFSSPTVISLNYQNFFLPNNIYYISTIYEEPSGYWNITNCYLSIITTDLPNTYSFQYNRLDGTLSDYCETRSIGTNYILNKSCFPLQTNKIKLYCLNTSQIIHSDTILEIKWAIMFDSSFPCNGVNITTRVNSLSGQAYLTPSTQTPASTICPNTPTNTILPTMTQTFTPTFTLTPVILTNTPTQTFTPIPSTPTNTFTQNTNTATPTKTPTLLCNSWYDINNNLGSETTYISSISFNNFYQLCIIGGSFSTPSNNFAISTYPDFTTWTGIGSGSNGEIMDVYYGNDINDIYITGNFTEISSITANYIATYSMGTWNSLGTGLNGIGNAIIGDGNGNYYVTGNFTIAGGISTNYIAKWNGSTFSALGTGLNAQGKCLSFDNDGNLYVGGNFTVAGGISTNYIAKWNGENWSSLGVGMNNSVYGISSDSENNIYACGNFTNAGGVSANYVAKWDGNSWTSLGTGASFSSGPTYVNAVAVMTDNIVFFGGRANIWDGVSARYISKWNGSTFESLGEGTNGVVKSLKVYGNNLFVGGYFTSVNYLDINSPYISLWKECGSIPTPINTFTPNTSTPTFTKTPTYTFTITIPTSTMTNTPAPLYSYTPTPINAQPYYLFWSKNIYNMNKTPTITPQINCDIIYASTTATEFSDIYMIFLSTGNKDRINEYYKYWQVQVNYNYNPTATPTWINVPGNCYSNTGDAERGLSFGLLGFDCSRNIGDLNKELQFRVRSIYQTPQPWVYSDILYVTNTEYYGYTPEFWGTNPLTNSIWRFSTWRHRYCETPTWTPTVTKTHTATYTITNTPTKTPTNTTTIPPNLCVCVNETIVANNCNDGYSPECAGPDVCFCATNTPTNTGTPTPAPPTCVHWMANIDNLESCTCENIYNISEIEYDKTVYMVFFDRQNSYLNINGAYKTWLIQVAHNVVEPTPPVWKNIPGNCYTDLGYPTPKIGYAILGKICGSSVGQTWTYTKFRIKPAESPTSTPLYNWIESTPLLVVPTYTPTP